MVWEGHSRVEGAGEAGVGVRGPSQLLPLGSCVGPLLSTRLCGSSDGGRLRVSLAFTCPPRKGALGSPLYRTWPGWAPSIQLHSPGP